MEDIVKKRTNLINFLLGEDKQYSKKDILNKEFSVLSFSPSEEYIDSLISPYDDLCVDLSTYKMDDAYEVYMKGIITDIDRQKIQTIIHIQNKDNVISITCKGETLNVYGDYFIVGEPIIAKCKVYHERAYLSMLININNLDEFNRERKYMEGFSQKKVESIMDRISKDDEEEYHYGLIVECGIVKTRKGKDMIIGTMFDGFKIRSFGSVKTFYNKKIPEHAIAGDFLRFKKPDDIFFIKEASVVKL